LPPAVRTGQQIGGAIGLAVLAITAFAIRVRGEDLAGGGTPVPQRPVSGAALPGRER
jgi:hypothetical protein